MPGRYSSGIGTAEFYPPNRGAGLGLVQEYQPINGHANGVSSLEQQQFGQLAKNGGRRNAYSVDHLVTWSVGPEHGVLTHEDGMRQLSKMEAQAGVFTMRCVLSVEQVAVHIVDTNTGELMEQFPLECVNDPVAVRDKNGVFNNIVLFTVVEDPKKRQSPSDMHIFRVVDRSARELADNLADAKAALSSRSSRSANSLTRATGRSQRAGSYDMGDMSPRRREETRAKKLPEAGDDSEEDVKQGIAMLNRCFDEVEKFVLRLKQSGKAFQELSKRKHSKNGRRFGDGMLTMRARVPPPADFFDCFQKFKLSLNLLARLKSYLHNPNAAELTHFLFTPLSLIVEASHDPRFDIRDLVVQVVTPLLSKQAVELLKNCLSSKEYELWMSLGESWTTPRDKWTHGHVTAFRPTFYDGWQPSESWMEAFLGNKLGTQAAEQAKRMSRDHGNLPQGLLAGSRKENYNIVRRTSNAVDLSPVSPQGSQLSPPFFVETAAENAVDGGKKSSTDSYQKNYLRDLQLRNAKIYEVLQDRKGNNTKELTIKKGEILEVLDDQRNWWKCANANGDQGFVPYTILLKYEPADVPLSPDYLTKSSAAPPLLPPAVIPPPPPAFPPPPNLDLNANKRSSNRRSSSSKEPPKSEPKKANSRISDDFSSELKQRLSRMNSTDSQMRSLNLSASMSAQVFIDERSSADDVADWLRRKGFQMQTQRMLAGYTGSEIFHLANDALLSEFGQQEGSRLISQLRLMKTTAGYTQSGSSQLRKILEQRKQIADNGDQHSHSSDGVSNADDSAEISSASAMGNGRINSARRY